MKNRRKMRIFQVYLHTSNYDIKEHVNVQNIIKEHIQQARNKQYEIIIIGDFNITADKPRLTETKYKRQCKIVQCFSKNTALRIDLM